jgi:hypothetical protein
MTRYQVNYDLRTEGQDYRSLIARLRQCGALRVLASTWLLNSEANIQAVRNDLSRFVDQNDGLIVTGPVDISAWEGDLLCTDEQLKAFFG